MSVLVTASLIASSGVDAAVVGLCLFRPSQGAVDMRRVQLAFVLGCLSFGPKAVFLTSLVGSFFFLLNLAYVDLVVLIPAAGLAVLIASRRRPFTPAVRALGAASLVLAPLGAFATFVEPARLVTEELAIPLRPEREGGDPLRVAVLADIQSCEVTERLHEAVRRTMLFEPHVILLPGDLMQCSSRAERLENTPAFRELLRPLSAPMGVWFVLGNTDQPDTVRDILAGTNVELLQDETRRLGHGDRRLLLAGADFASRSAVFVRGLERHADDGEIVVLLAHYPDVMHDLERDSRVDLVVAGHTHGGQVNVPFFGPPITLSSVPRRVAAGGYHQVEGVRIYVSRGIGCERASAPRIRLNCPPELTLLTLE